MKSTSIFIPLVALSLSFLSLANAQEQEIRKARDVSEPAAVAAPSAPAVHDASDNYKLRTNDKLVVKVFDEENLSGVCVVREDGTVRLPLINEAVRVSGMSLTDVENRIRALLAKDYVRDPKVTVNIAEMSKFKFSVMGQVNRAGAWEYGNNKRVTLLEAIAMAGGFTRLANEKEVYLKRIVSGKEQVYTVNVKKMASSPEASIYLQDGDVITVKESGF